MQTSLRPLSFVFPPSEGVYSNRTESFSSLGTFKRCPRKYYYRYLSGEEEGHSEVLSHGKDIHEKIHKRKGGEPEVDFALARIGEKKKTKYRLANLGQLVHMKKNEGGVIELSEERYALDDSLTTLVDFNSPRAFFRGVVDYAEIRLDKEELDRATKGAGVFLGDLVSSVEIVDWKTGKYRTERRQLSWYSLFFFALLPFLEEVACQQVFVTERQESFKWTVTSERIKEIQQEIREAVADVRGGCQWPAHPTHLCGWCGYRNVCDAERPARWGRRTK